MTPILEVYEVATKGKSLGWRFQMVSDSEESEGITAYVSSGLYPDCAEATRVATRVNGLMFCGELDVVVP